MAPLEIWLKLNLLNLLAKLKREKYISHFIKGCPNYMKLHSLFLEIT
jgi:hypothetical protein